MKNSVPISLVAALVVAASVALSCGSPADPSSPGDPLESITVTPAAADANDYPNGQVQFTATGYYSTNPKQGVALSKPNWGSCYQNAPTSEVTVSSSGVAQCANGAVGTFTVWADAPPIPNGPTCLAMNACGGGCFVVGNAQLTCP
jgi:hypothetical protein